MFFFVGPFIPNDLKIIARERERKKRQGMITNFSYIFVLHSMSPFPMMGYPGAAGSGMMNFSGTIHINPKFAGNPQLQQEMMMIQQQQWQQTMAFQRGGMPFYNNNQQRYNPNNQKPHGGQRPFQEVRSVTESLYKGL
jgi:hypothetical protein